MEENQTAPVEYNGNQIKDRTEGFAAPSPVSREKPQRDWGNLGINESWQQLREERIQNAINEAPTVLGGVRSMVAAEQRNREQHRAAQQARVGLAQESLELRRQELADRIRHNAIMRGELNPDSEAMIRDIAAELGVSEEAVRTDPEFYKNKLSAEQLAKITAQNPSTASFYSNPDNVAVAHDDSSALTAFENAFKAIGDTNVAEAEAWGSDEYGKFGTSFAAGAIRDFGGAVLEGASAIIEQSGNLQNFDPNEDGYVSTRIEDKDARDALYAPSNAINDWVNGWDVPKDEQTFLTQVGAAMGQFAGQTVAAVATGGASAVASPLTLILQGAGSMHKQLLEDREKLAKEGKPIPTEMEEAIALYAGTAITALTEKFGLEAVYGKYTPKLIALAEKYGLNKIVKMYESQAGRMALNRLVGGIGEGFQENTENILQTALRKGLIDKDIKMPTGAELFDEFAVSFVSSLAFGAVADMRSTVNSIHENQALTAAADAAQESKLRGRQTQLFQSFVEGTTPEGRKTIYIEKDAWDKHHEGLGLDPAKAAERYGIENYGESPHYLEMPTSRWASDFASTEAFNALKPHIKINADPSYLTPSETSTKIKMQKAVDKQLSAYAAGLESEGNLMPKTTEAGTKIIDYIANQLGARWQDGTARTNATLFASAFVNMQIRDAQSKNPNATDEEIANNITTDLFERYALKVNALAHINNAMQRVDVKMDPLIEQLRSRAKGTNARLNEAEEQELKDLRGIKSKDLTPEQRARRDELVARKNGILRTSKHKIFVPEGVEGRPDSGEINVVISHNADGSVTVNDDDFFGVTTINSDHAKNLGSDEAILKDRYPAVYGSHETISDISYQASPEMSDELKALDEDIKAAGIDLTQTTDNNQVRDALMKHLQVAADEVRNTDVTEFDQSAFSKNVPVSKEERKAIAEQCGGDKDLEQKILNEVQSVKNMHRISDGWHVPVFDKVEKGKAAFKIIPYQFDEDADKKTIKRGEKGYRRRINNIAGYVVEEVRRIFIRAQNGDQKAVDILKEAGWYRNMRARLRDEFGGFGDFIADTLGATSPNTPVRENWKNTMLFLQGLTKGNYDNMIPVWENWDKVVENIQKDLDEYVERERAKTIEKTFKNGTTKTVRERSDADIKKDDAYRQLVAALKAAKKDVNDILPTKENGKKFGMNGRNVLRSLLDKWRVVNEPDTLKEKGKTAPKAITFSGNLIGYNGGATIDVWAARFLQRLCGKRRIPSRCESGVSGDLLPNNVTTLQFGIGQDVFAEAVKRIRADEQLSTNDVLSKINNDDLQAVAWFIEKEIWATNGWTTAEGEGGSFEYEADLEGNPDKEKIDAARKILNGKKYTEEQKAEARKVIEASRSRVSRWLGGLSMSMSEWTQGGDYIPDDTAQAQAARELLNAVVTDDETGDKLIAARANTTLGFYEMDGEVSFDIEASVRDGFNPTNLFRKMVQIAKDKLQDSMFISRVLREGEDIDMTRHRPGVEIYFKEAQENGSEVVKKIQNFLLENGHKSYTLITDGRRNTSALNGIMPRAVGIRLQFIPEFDERFGGDYNGKKWSDMSDDEIVNAIKEKQDDYEDLAEEIGTFTDVTHAKQYWYATTALFNNEYDRYLNGNNNPEAGEDGLSGKTEEAATNTNQTENNSQDRAGTAPDGTSGIQGQDEGRRADLSLPHEISQGDTIANAVARAKAYAENPTMPKTKAEVERAAGRVELNQGEIDGQLETGSGPDEGPGYVTFSRGRLRAESLGTVEASWGTSQEHSVQAVGVHYSSAERKTLDGRYYGTGLDGAEYQRVMDAKDTRLRERIYFYIDTGNGITPESGVGNHVHAIKLNNLYDIRRDPLKLLDKAYAEGKTDSERQNLWESMVIDAGFDGYINNKAMAVENPLHGETKYMGVAVLLGRNIPKPEHKGIHDGVESKYSGPEISTEDEYLIPVGWSVQRELSNEDKAKIREAAPGNQWVGNGIVVRESNIDAVRAILGDKVGGDPTIWSDKSALRKPKFDDAAPAQQSTDGGKAPTSVEITIDNSNWSYSSWKEVLKKLDAMPGVKMSGGKVVMSPSQEAAVKEALGSYAGAVNKVYGGATVFNQSGDNRRGSIVKNNGKFTINLFKKADFSTFAHETGHFMLFMLEEMATRDGASDWAKSEWEHVKNYLGLKDGVPITTKQHEKFARSFEAYLREGKAPSVELQDVFSRFKAWLLDIYKTVAKLKAPINNEIRGVFDRLLASDQQIELAKQANGFIQNLFSSAKDMGVSQEEFDAYQKLGERAINDAKDKMLERLMQDNRREKTKEWQEEQKKVEQKLRQDYKELPDVINLQTLTDPTGFIKISTDELKSRYGKEWMSKLPKIGKNKIHADNGMAIDEAAKLLGYETGDDMMDALSNLPSEDEFVKQNAEAEMRRRHGDLLTSEAIADAATEALMNDKREDLLLKELSILDRMKRMVDAVNKAKAKADAKEAKEETRRQNQFIRISKAIYREGAKAIIWGKKIRDIKPGVYLSAIRKAREDAIKAMAAKDYNAAFDAKQQELLSTLLYREARDMIKNVEANKRKFARINKGNEKKLAKTREMSFIYRARYLLARHGLGRNADQWMEKLRIENKNGNDIDMTEEPPVEYWLMSAEEFSSFADLVNGLWYQSRAFKTAEIDGKKVEIRQIGEEISAVMEAQGIADVSEPDSRNKLVTAVDAYATSMKRVEQQFTMMGGETGPLMKYIFQPMKDACVSARLKYSEVVEQLNNIVTKLTFHPGEIVAKELIDRDTGKAHVFGRGKVSGGAEVWGALLHSGNPSNLRKLLLGYGWCKENPDGTIDTRNWDLFLIRMQKEGILTKGHMDAAQAIWDVYEELKPLSQKANKYIYGYHFKEVDAPGITNVFGSYRGGYVPARCDTRLVKDAEVRKIQEEHNKSAHNLLGMTQPGFTQSRVENYADKLDLNPQTIMSGTADIVNFAYIAPVYKDVARILRSNLVSSAFHRYEPGYMTTVIHPWMNRAMMQTATTDLSSEGARTIADLRSKAGALLMFFNIKNTVQQMADLVVSASQVKRPGNFMSALMNSGKKGREFAMEKSIFMRDRMGESQHQMMDRINEILVDASRLDKYNRWFMNHAYFTQQLADDWASTVTWIACYNDALQDGADDLDAVRHADAAVRRVLMSQNPEDVSNIESGTAFYRAFTQFSGFFVTRSNVVFSELGAIAREAGARAEDSNATKAMKILANRKMKAGMVIFTKVALPAVLDTALALAVKGILPDDDEWQADIFEGAAEYVIGLGGPLLNLGKNVVSIGKEMITGEKKYGNNPRMASAPFVSIIEDIMSQARKIYTKKNGINPEAILKLATDATMFTAHVPMQLSRDIGYLMKVQQGKVKPTGPIDFVRGAITGVASPASK